MLYSTFYARLVPNGGTSGTKYGVSVSGITAVVDADKTWTSGPMLFAIKPKSSGLATVTFHNITTGDVLGTKDILVRSTTKAKPTYKLTASATSVNEGGTVTFTLDTSDIAPNANVAYKITGVSLSDISLTSLTGNFKVGTDGTSTLVVTIKEDQVTDGNKTLKLELTTDPTIFKEVTLVDTSLSPKSSGSATFTVNKYAEVNGTWNYGVATLNDKSIVPESFGQILNDSLKINTNVLSLYNCYILDGVTDGVSIWLDVANRQYIDNLYTQYGESKVKLELTITNINTAQSLVLTDIVKFTTSAKPYSGWARILSQAIPAESIICNNLRELFVVGNNVKIELTYSIIP